MKFIIPNTSLEFYLSDFPGVPRANDFIDLDRFVPSTEPNYTEIFEKTYLVENVTWTRNDGIDLLMVFLLEVT
jgi:hypothetical protein